MKILIACECSGKVKEAFRLKGHEAYSCDILPSYGSKEYHIQDDVLRHLNVGWDMIIAFPPCTRLCSSGARWWKTYPQEQKEAIAFFMSIADADCPKIAIENPIGIMSSRWRKPDQIIQPWQFGHGETKATCLWLKGLERLKATDIVSGRDARVHKMPPSKDRAKLRSETYQGVADAMADQWG